ncbi:MAG: hypothetical protein ABIH26_14945 [Candidatus Eisenbacteria bacterium]
MRPLLALLLAALAVPPAHGEGKALLSERTYRLGYASLLLPGEDRTGPYPLPHRPIVRGTETVVLHGRTMEREKDYWIRYDRGEITFAFALVAGDRVEIRYRHLPLDLFQERYLHKLRLAEGEGETVLAARPPEPMSGPLDTGALRVGGSKSFSVLVGSGRALSLEQALRVSVTGNLAPDVRVTAQLTDQNLPIQAEGRSERLEELDQVLVKVESPRFDATLGDYEVRFGETEFGRYDRVLKGALGRWKGQRYETEGSAGLSKGTYRSVEIRGVEGKQGAYSLTGVSALGEVVVSGSEQVWVDGERMARGEGNDYVIDYSEGTITFNPGRRISSDSRIAVDFQTTGDEYRRSFATGRFRIGGGEERFALRGVFLSEQDDEDEPEAIVLDDAEYDSLRASGDRRPLGSSARYVEEGGDYDTTGGVFVYAGRDSGSFAVSFRETAPGEGSYADSISEVWGQRIFVHVGGGNGDHEPTVPVPLPSSHRVFVLNGTARPLGALRLATEVAWSDLDRNTLSPLDDGDNTGSGVLLSAALGAAALRLGGADIGSLDLRGSHSSVTEHFEPLGRYREPHRDGRWMTSDLRGAIGPGRRKEDRVGSGDAFVSRGEEATTLASGTFRRGTAAGTMTLSGEGGRLSAPRFESDRWSWNAAMEDPNRYRASYGEERIASDEADTLQGETFSRSGEASLRLSAFRPSIRVARGRRTFDQEETLFRGTRNRDERFGLSAGTGSFEAGGAVAFEERDYVDSSTSLWERWYEGRTDEATLRWRGPVSVGAQYTHRTLAYGETATEGSRRSDLGRLEVRHGGFGGVLRADWNYEATTEERKSRRRLLLRAPAGREADYDSLGNYFPGEGNFNQVIVEGDPQPVIDLEVGATVRIEPGRRKGSASERWWERLGSETFVRVQERSTTEDRADLLLLRPGAFQRNDATIRGSTVLRQEFRWTDPRSEGSVRLRFQREDREENEYESQNRDDLIRTFLVRGMAPLGDRVAGELEWNRRLEEERSNDERAVDLSGDDWKATLLYDPTPRWRFRFPVAYQAEREAVRDETVRSVRVEPEAALNLAARSRLDAGLAWVRFLEEEIDRGGSFLRNRREGIRWRLQFAYEWNTVLSSTVAYSGENLKGEEISQQFRAEMRAFF